MRLTLALIFVICSKVFQEPVLDSTRNYATLLLLSCPVSHFMYQSSRPCKVIHLYSSSSPTMQRCCTAIMQMHIIWMRRVTRMINKVEYADATRLFWRSGSGSAMQKLDFNTTIQIHIHHYSKFLLLIIIWLLLQKQRVALAFSIQCSLFDVHTMESWSITIRTYVLIQRQRCYSSLLGVARRTTHSSRFFFWIVA